MVATAPESAKATVPGPLTWLQVVVTVPGEFGNPSSVTVPASIAPFGNVTVWSAPAATAGGSLAGGTRELYGQLALEALELSREQGLDAETAAALESKIRSWLTGEAGPG